MLTQRIIPSLLLRRGRLVKGVAFDSPRDAGNPATTARAYNAQTADELILLDIDASREDRGPDLDTVAAVASECLMPLTVGGGISNTDIATRCLTNGADKICVNTTAFDRPELISELATRFGSQAVVLGIDVIHDGNRYQLFDHRHKRTVLDRNWLDWMSTAVSLGAGEIRLMVVGREGSRTGFDTEAYAAAARYGLPVILEGGGGKLGDLAVAMAAGVSALALGTMLVFSDNNIVQLKRYLKNTGQEIRI